MTRDRSHLIAAFAVIAVQVAAVHVAVTPARTAAAAGRPELHFSDGQSKIIVQADRAGDLFLVPVKINGEAAGLFLVDTGASQTITDPQVAQRFKLPRVGAANLTGASGARRSAAVRAVRSLSVSGVTVTSTFVMETDLTELNKTMLIQSRLAGVLGGDFLAAVPFTLDPVDGRPHGVG